MKKIILLVLTLSLLSSNSYAAEKSEITVLFDKYDEIMKSLEIAQEKLAVDDLDYTKLLYIHSQLSESRVQIDSIENQLFISELVTDEKLKVRANRFIFKQKESIAKQNLIRSNLCEKFLTHIKSAETSSLILQARDVFKESAKMLNH
jgi:hypothetical protein